MFVNVVASIQYRALADKANDAFYKLSNTRSQIQAYVFDGIIKKSYFLLSTVYAENIKICQIFMIKYISGIVG